MDLSYLKNKNIAVLGHDNADIDSVISGIMIDKLFKYLGIKSRFIILDKIVEQKISSLLLKYGVDASIYKSKLEEDYLFLVDHNETKYKGTILGVIDHHKSNLKHNYPIYINSTSASATIHIYRIMRDLKYPFTKDDITLILLATYTDSCSLKSSKVTIKDKEDVAYLISKYNIDKNLLHKDGLLIRDVSKMTIDDIIKNGLKEYNTDNIIFNSSYLRIDNVSTAKSIELQVIIKVREILNNTSDNNKPLDFWIFVFVCVEDNKTVVLNINKNSVETYIAHGLLSRGRDIIPNIKEKSSVLAI